MNRLWTALGILAHDAEFRAKVEAMSDMVDRPELPDKPFDLRKQPSMQALADINNAFVTKKKLHLSAYELAEVNRWLYDDRVNHNGSMTVLADYWASLDAPLNPSPSFLEAAGALALDSGMRFRLAQDQTATFVKTGFAKLEPDEETRLLAAVQTNSVADNKANEFVALSWPGSHCLGILSAYPQYLHPNI